MHCAVMQLMIAVGHRHVHPMPTNPDTVNPPIECDVGYPLGFVTKIGFLANGSNHLRMISLII